MKPKTTLEDKDLAKRQANVVDVVDGEELINALQTINDNFYQIEENRRKNMESLAQFISLAIVSLFFGLMSPILGLVVFFVISIYQYYQQSRTNKK